MSEIQPVTPDLRAIHIGRSEFIDAFGEIEQNLSAILKAGGISCTNTPITQRLTVFKNLDANARLTKQNLGRRNQLADKISMLMPLRTDIVHSVLVGCIVDGITTAKLVNAQVSSDKHPLCRLLNASDFNHLSHEARKIASDLLALARNPNPASSPPPPSPDEATDP